jgi:hypothetical protein
MEKKTLNFLLKSNFLKRPDLSKCFDKYSFLAWIKDIKTDRFVEVRTEIKKNLKKNLNFYTNNRLLIRLKY